MDLRELSGLARVRQMARRSKDVQFTALMHHINVDLLRQSYYALKRNSAPGIDGMTWKKYGEAIEESLQSLNNKIHRGTYRPRPAKRTMIPKADGTQRPLSIIILYSIV